MLDSRSLGIELLGLVELAAAVGTEIEEREGRSRFDASVGKAEGKTCRKSLAWAYVQQVGKDNKILPSLLDVLKAGLAETQTSSEADCWWWASLAVLAVLGREKVQRARQHLKKPIEGREQTRTRPVRTSLDQLSRKSICRS